MVFREESVRRLMMLKLLVKKIQRGIKHSIKERHLNALELADGIAFGKEIPEDVKQGHFAVIAMKGGEPKRFIMDLEHLEDPAFMKLLEDAEEEFGFQQQGVLSVPCQPEEIQMIIGDRRRRRMSTEW